MRETQQRGSSKCHPKLLCLCVQHAYGKRGGHSYVFLYCWTKKKASRLFSPSRKNANNCSLLSKGVPGAMQYLTRKETIFAFPFGFSAKCFVVEISYSWAGNTREGGAIFRQVFEARVADDLPPLVVLPDPEYGIKPPPPDKTFFALDFVNETLFLYTLFASLSSWKWRKQSV